MKNVLLLLGLLAFGFTANAQFKKGHHEKIRAYKIAFLTEKLDLSEKEAEKFWPIYNAYDKQMMQLRKEEHYGFRKKIKEMGGFDQLSEKQAKEILQNRQKLNEERQKLKNNFYAKIIKIISYKKLLTLEFSEHEFNKKLLRKLRKGRSRSRD